MSEALLWNEIGSLYQKMGMLDESIQACQKAVELSPDSAEFNCNLAHSFFQGKEYGCAIALYRKSLPLLKTAREQAQAWNHIGDAYRALKDLDNAIAAYRKADELDLQPSTQPAPATQSMQKTLPEAELKPAATAPRLALPAIAGNAASTPPAATRVVETPASQPRVEPVTQPRPQTPAQPKPAPAPAPAARSNDPSLEETLSKVSVYEKVTQANPGNHRAWDTLGKLYKALGRYQDAIAAYRHAIELAPQVDHYFYYLGLLFAAVQESDNAVLAFESVLEINPDYTLAHSALAGLYNRMGMVAKANQHIADALPLMNNESSYNRACFYAICGDVELATEFLRLALQNKDTSLEWIKNDPDLDTLRGNERYLALIQEFEDPPTRPTEGSFFSSNTNRTENHLLPLLNNSLAR